MSSDIDYIGFANLPNQLHRKNVKKGFEFTIMVVGESGLGKSTLINAMFKTDLHKDRKVMSATQQNRSTLKIETNTFEIEESGVKLKITVVDTPGFGDSLDSKNCCKPIISYIEEQFEKYFNHESDLNRRHISDSRVHCCFYFISPENYGLKPLDISAMKSLHNKVNLIPIIGKSDFLTKEESEALKKRILSELKSNEIQIYSIPDCDDDEDEEYKQQIRQLKTAVPFAVNSSLEFHEVKGRKVRGRSYTWGIVETENPEHSDFIKLRAMLVSHLQDLKDVTKDVHYENYRTHKLVSKNISNSDLSLKDNVSITSDDRDGVLMEKETQIKKLQEMIEKMKNEMMQTIPNQMKDQEINKENNGFNH